MSAQHTPGPWSVPHFADMLGGCKCGYVFSESQRGMGSICSVVSGGENEEHEQAIANARLIAAAPDLLAACQAYMADRAEAGCTADSGAVKAMRAAIEKASGMAQQLGVRRV